MNKENVLKWVGIVFLVFVLTITSITLWKWLVNGQPPVFMSKGPAPATASMTISNITVKVVMDEKTEITKPSDKLTVVEEGHIRRDTVGMPEITEWADLARKVDKDVPNWIVPVQYLKGIPYLALSEEVGKEPTFVVPDRYKDLYRWHQVTADEAGVMNIRLMPDGGGPESNFSFQKQTLRFIGKVWVLEKIEAVLETPATTTGTPETAAGEDPPGTKTVTGAPAP